MRHSGVTLRKRVSVPLGLLLLSGAWSRPVLAQTGMAEPVDLMAQPTFLLAIIVAIAACAVAVVLTRRITGKLHAAEMKVSELEVLLNDSEAAITAEPHILVLWRERGGPPERIIGDMRGTAAIPAKPDALLDYAAWLETESAMALEEAVAALRDTGRAFNLGVRTRTGDIVEADGRTAGGLATLRLRPLAGDRRNVMGLEADVRDLGRQVDRLSTVLDSAPFPIWLKTGAGAISWANQAYIRSVEAPDLAGVVLGDIALYDSARLEPAPAGSTGILGRSYTVIGGAKRALDISLIDIDGAQAGFANDVTALEATARELKRHIEAHASTLDKLDTAIAIFGPDQSLRFHNAAYARLWDLDPDWLATHPRDGEILDKLRSNRVLPEQANFRDWKSRQLQTYTTLEIKEDWWYLPDGRTLHVICEQHPFGGLTYLYENATNEIQLQSQLNELTGVQSETLDNLHEGVALIGSDGRLKLFNPAFARFWGLEPGFLRTSPHIDEVTARARRLLDDDLHWDEVKYGVTGLDANRSDHKGRVARPDGTVLDFGAVPLADGNTLLTYVDVTDSSRIESALRERTEALEAADRLKTGFLSNVSYQLRTPLTNIIGYSQALTMGIAGAVAPRQAEYLQSIHVSSEQLLAIIDDILDLTTIDAGAMELKLAPVDVTALLSETANDVATRLARRDMELSVEISEDVTSFVGDSQRIRQILRNLLSNAISFSADRSTIRMGAKCEGSEMLLWVADRGRGIDPEFQKRAFERFQARHVPGGHRGPGLGLALVKSFVELHEGHVSLISKIEHGTTVICRFPLQGPHHEASRAISAA